MEGYYGLNMKSLAAHKGRSMVGEVEAGRDTEK
jgi:hypothetical protein